MIPKYGSKTTKIFISRFNTDTNTYVISMTIELAYKKTILDLIGPTPPLMPRDYLEKFK